MVSAHSHLRAPPQAWMNIPSDRWREKVPRRGGRGTPAVFRRGRLSGRGPWRLSPAQSKAGRGRATGARTQRSGSSCRAPSCGRGSMRSAPRWSSPRRAGTRNVEKEDIKVAYREAGVIAANTGSDMRAVSTWQCSKLIWQTRPGSGLFKERLWFCQ